MAQITKLIAQMRVNPKNVKFADLAKVCNYYSGNPRQKGTSHCVYKTSWEGDPRVNIQSSSTAKNFKFGFPHSAIFC